MTEHIVGRGAFPRAGSGGTLKLARDRVTTVPGGYFMVASKGVDLVGITAFRKLKLGQVPDVNELAVHYGVRALQTELNANLDRGMTGALVVDGILGRASDGAIKEYQTSKGLKADGIIGPATCKRIFTAVVERIYAQRSAPVHLGVGLCTYESGFDPAAVGRVDLDDLGLCQINGRAHPDMSAEARLTPEIAIAWQADFTKYLLLSMGNERDAVAAYNLGVGGARTWIKAGRPDPWTPAGATEPRSVVTYVDKVLGVAA